MRGNRALGTEFLSSQPAEVRAGISEVIGSADGKKFRSYAQSLTEVLLGYANEHLRSLASRYAVIRVPSSEMELQMVDRDMGDEVRSVNSLSGGEGFLVSLALALGLSSLSSHTTRVESLFIDEGFGSLDPDTPWKLRWRLSIRFKLPAGRWESFPMSRVWLRGSGSE